MKQKKRTILITSEISWIWILSDDSILIKGPEFFAIEIFKAAIIKFDFGWE